MKDYDKALVLEREFEDKLKDLRELINLAREEVGFEYALISELIDKIIDICKFLIGLGVPILITANAVDANGIKNSKLTSSMFWMILAAIAIFIALFIIKFLIFLPQHKKSTNRLKLTNKLIDLHIDSLTILVQRLKKFQASLKSKK